MPDDNILDEFKSFLEGKKSNTNFFSPVFVALRDCDKNCYTDVNMVIEHYKKYIENGIYDIKYKKEDSHYLLYFKTNNVPYITKIRFDNDGLIHSLVEEIEIKGFRNVVLTVSYDGSNYYGIQRQQNDNLDTIQHEIEMALKKMLSKDVRIIVSSRTDRGVHAIGQVIQFESFGIKKENYVYALNNILKKDIRIIDAKYRSQVFNCRFDTVKKEYNYIIDTGEYSVFRNNYFLFDKINDLNRIKKEIKSLIGTHDFRAFCKGENDNTIRTIYSIKIVKEGSKIIFKFVGSGFLHNMIRLIMGSLLEIDKTGKGSIKEILESKDKRSTMKLASASGLYLMKIQY